VLAQPLQQKGEGEAGAFPPGPGADAFPDGAALVEEHQNLPVVLRREIPFLPPAGKLAHKALDFHILGQEGGFKFLDDRLHPEQFRLQTDGGNTVGKDP